jgi:DNA-directed RNA polymerase specialized sigma24 family protein
MRTQNSYEEVFGSDVDKRIHIRAAQVSKLDGFSSSDREDIEQEIAIRIMGRVDGYDAERGSRRMFMARLVDNAVAEIIAERRSPSRNPTGRECSLDELIPDGEGSLVKRADTLDHESHLGHSGPLTEKDLADIHLDLAEVEGELPPRLRELCARLMQERPSDFSKRTGVPKTTVYRWRDRIRERLERLGIGEYSPRKSGKKAAGNQ